MNTEVIKCLKCESKFLYQLLIGLFILNGCVYFVTKLLKTPIYFTWVVEGSVLTILIYICYFVYRLIKSLFWGYSDDGCKNLPQRVASWLSSLI